MSTPRLADKTALITGGGAGIGAAAATLFCREGAAVLLVDADAQALERTRQAILQDLPDARVLCVAANVADEAAARAAVQQCTAQLGGLDILVNNAGVVELHSPETISEAEYRFVMAVSVDGTIWGTKYAIPAMNRRGGGSIVNMSSIASLQGEYYVAAYCAAKGAVEAYTRATAVYCAQADYRIRCNSVHPAGIDTPMVRSVPDKMAAAKLAPLNDQARSSGVSPLGRPDDIANLVLFLASDESRFISGQSHVVDNSASVTMGVVPGGRPAD